MEAAQATFLCWSVWSWGYRVVVAEQRDQRAGLTRPRGTRLGKEGFDWLSVRPAGQVPWASGDWDALEKPPAAGSISALQGPRPCPAWGPRHSAAAWPCAPTPTQHLLGASQRPPRFSSLSLPLASSSQSPGFLCPPSTPRTEPAEDRWDSGECVQPGRLASPSGPQGEQRPPAREGVLLKWRRAQLPPTLTGPEYVLGAWICYNN